MTRAPQPLTALLKKKLPLVQSKPQAIRNTRETNVLKQHGPQMSKLGPNGVSEPTSFTNLLTRTNMSDLVEKVQIILMPNASKSFFKSAA